MTQTPPQTPSSDAPAAELRAILKSAVIASSPSMTRPDRNINPATERLFGYSAAELVGQNVKMLMPDLTAEHDGYSPTTWPPE